MKDKFQGDYVTVRVGRYDVVMADARTLVQIIFEIPGNTAKALRQQFALDICRLIGGDENLVEDAARRYGGLSGNALSFVQSSYAGSGSGFPAMQATDSLEIMERKAQLERYMVDTQRAMVDTQRAMVDNFQSTMNILEGERNRFDGDDVMQAAVDDQVRTYHQNSMRAIVSGNSHTNSQITENGEGAASESRFCPDFSSLLQERGLRFSNARLSALGKHISRCHLEHYGYYNTNKTRTFCNGKTRLINAYTIDKLETIEHWIDEFIAQEE